MCLPCLASEAGWVCLYCPTEGALEGTGLESNQTAGHCPALPPAVCPWASQLPL